VKWRTIGLDLQGLEAQMAERRTRDEQAAQADREAAAQAIAWDQELMRLQAEAHRARRDYNKAVGDFRKTQTLAGTREFDLNDPDALKKDRPAREGDDDPRLGPASLQKFDGEDLQRQAREETLRQELLDTWHAQRADLEARARAARETDEDYANVMSAQAAALGQLVRDAEEARRAMNSEVLRRNLEMAAEQRDRQSHEQAMEQMTNEAEIDYHRNDPWLNEHPGTTVNPAGTLRKDNYKGMSPEELRAIQEVREVQVRAAEARRAAAAADELEYARQMVAVKRAMDDMERRRREFMATQNRSMAEFQRTQAADAAERTKTLNETYSNRVTPDYFQQFGRSHR